MTRDDADALFDLDQDTDVMHFINGGKMTSMEDILSVSIPRLESYADQSEGWGIWKVSLRGEVDDSKAYLGWVLVRPMDFFSEAPQYNNLELGWRFKQSSWGHGFATEAAKMVMDTVCAPLKITRVSALALEQNVASINIMKKLGMKFLMKKLHHDPLGDMELVFYQKLLK